MIKVLIPGSEGTMALAIGIWDGKPTLAQRWNGNDDEGPTGCPQAYGNPYWFIVESGFFTDAIVDKLSPEQQTFVRTIIPKAIAA